MGIGTTMQQEQTTAKRSLMKRLLHSQGGNVAVMGAAIILPTTLMIGSGIDYSRYYVIKSRMQMACDAGALAGRKVMGKTSFSSDALVEAEKFFDANFVDGSYGSVELDRQYTETDGIVEGEASAKMNTYILTIAQMDEMNIAVKCNGKLDIANTDVTFVLDTTGSMDTIDAGSASSRMSGLRQAVKDFSTTMEDAKSSRTVIRYGFVPYASNVRVGHLLRREWLSDSNTIQSREAVLDGTWFNMGGTDSGWQRISGTATATTTNNLSSCTATNATRTNFPTTTDTVTNPDGSQTTTIVESYHMHGTQNVCTRTSSSPARYRRDRTVFNNAIYTRTTTSSRRPNYSWRYYPRPYDLTTLKGDNGGLALPGATQTYPVGNLSNGWPSDRVVSWNGCIEEARTSHIPNFNNLPSPLYDLNINHVPDANNDTKWKMQVPGLTFGRGKEVTPSPPHSYFQSGSFIENEPPLTQANYYNAQDASMATCNNTARALTSMTPADVGSYVDGLEARGGTYHDIGMIWGGRLASPNGIFGASNTAAASAGLTRHIIFMTDGSTSPTDVALTAYGVEPLDKRRMGYWDGGNRQPAIDMANQRLQVVCDQIKNENITLWVVAFGTDVLNSASTKQNLEDCASPGKYFEAANNTVLRAQFVKIASQIAELRLVQ